MSVSRFEKYFLNILIFTPNSVRRVYADVNKNRAAEYWDYENLNINWGYAIYFIVRTGKFVY